MRQRRECHCCEGQGAGPCACACARVCARVRDCARVRLRACVLVLVCLCARERLRACVCLCAVSGAGRAVGVVVLLDGREVGVVPISKNTSQAPRHAGCHPPLCLKKPARAGRLGWLCSSAPLLYGSLVAINRAHQRLCHTHTLSRAWQRRREAVAQGRGGGEARRIQKLLSNCACWCWCWQQQHRRGEGRRGRTRGTARAAGRRPRCRRGRAGWRCSPPDTHIWYDMYAAGLPALTRRSRAMTGIMIILSLAGQKIPHTERSVAHLPEYPCV